MNLDREQIQQDAERVTHYGNFHELGVIERTADHCFALLAELEQAEARLARVPALVEALRECEEALVVMPVVENSAFYALVKAQQALSVWDAEQPGPDRTP